jgi:hypothetical protein
MLTIKCHASGKTVATLKRILARYGHVAYFDHNLTTIDPVAKSAVSQFEVRRSNLADSKLDAS